MNNEIADRIIKSANRLGINPLHLGTVISYETAGTFNPAKRGPTTKWGQHIGLIQMGGPQRREHGYDPKGDLDSQFRAVESYLKKAGVKPGTGLVDLYSAINTGGTGKRNWSKTDRAAGGAPGTVLDKVTKQMGGHMKKAERLLGGQYDPTQYAEDGNVPTPPSRRMAGLPGEEAEPTVEEMIAALTEPTDDPRRLEIRKLSDPLLADLLPPGQGQAVPGEGDSGEPAGLAALSSLLGQTSASPATAYASLAAPRPNEPTQAITGNHADGFEMSPNAPYPPSQDPDRGGFRGWADADHA